MSVTEFGFGENDTNMGGKTENFTLKNGETARITLVHYPLGDDGILDLVNNKSPKFIRGERLYVPGAGYFLNNGPEFVKLAGQDPKLRIATLIIRWPEGDKASLSKAQVLPWILDDKKYHVMARIHKEWDLRQVDLEITCAPNGAKFQDVTMMATRSSLLQAYIVGKPDETPEKREARLTLLRAVSQNVQSQASTLINKIGRNLTIEELRQKIAAAGGAAGAPPSPIRASANGSSADIDSALDDL